ATLAFLATTTMARARPDVARGRLRVTLGPSNLLWVKTPALVHGLVDTMTATSSPSSWRRPAWPVWAMNPLGRAREGIRRLFQVGGCGCRSGDAGPRLQRVPPGRYGALLSSCSRQRRISE